MLNILLVDDERESRSYLAEFLREQGHRVAESADGSEALDIFTAGEFHLVLTDIRMPKMSGLELLRKIRGMPGGQDVDVVLFTGNGDVRSAIEALRAGAYDYLLKPINVEELVAVTERAGERQALRRENAILTKKFKDAVEAATEETRQELSRFKKAYYESIGLGNIGVFSQAMKKIFQQARKLHTDRSIPVLIEGETGTGKEVIARYIHYGDGNVTAPFVDLNCAAIAPNLFESELFGYEAGAFTGGTPRGQKGKLDLAQGGTLFLDEITEIPTDLQAKLLRVIQEKEFYRVGGLKKIKTDVRIVCATNVDIEKKVEEGAFRRDLYYRLNVGRISLPPLRERTEPQNPDDRRRAQFPARIRPES
ncbi:MAG: sigma-54 dependent transcriptional regulator [Peptococcaceae bacterium]|nr:sigma-54 dependent transcriptional regulator [Peptococcaceae bacterium]